MSGREYGIGQRLWEELETPQGFSFVSDAMISMSDAEVLNFVRANLGNVRKVARVFSRVAREYEFVSDAALPARTDPGTQQEK